MTIFEIISLGYYWAVAGLMFGWACKRKAPLTVGIIEGIFWPVILMVGLIYGSRKEW